MRKQFVWQVTSNGVLAGFQHAFVRSASATPFVSRLGLGEYGEIFTHNEAWLLLFTRICSALLSALLVLLF